VNTFLFGQDTIRLQNPSFEDVPRMAKAPTAWYDCGFPNESMTDIHSGDTDYFNVSRYPTDGATHIGMVVRDNDTWEMISQRLPEPLNAGISYHFTVDLCRADVYVSPSRVTGQVINYTNPVKLRVWGGNGYCQKKELLVETPLVINTRWLTSNLVIAPTEDFSYLVFECFYKTPNVFPYNGNLLMDNLSPIVEISMKVADSLSALKPQNITNNELSNVPIETRQQLTLAQVDSLDNANREWSTVGIFTKTIDTLLQEMEIDLNNKVFSDATSTQLKQLLKDFKKNAEYDKIVFGILGDKKRRKQLSQPIYEFMEANSFNSDQIKIVKVPIGDLDENWVGSNEFYRLRLE
jgi:hypothetical protein